MCGFLQRISSLPLTLYHHIDVIDIDCDWLSRAWWRYIRDLLSPRPCTLIVPEVLIFILTWVQHLEQCKKDNPSRCYHIFSSTISPLLPISQAHPYTSIVMIMAKHQQSYLKFLETFPLLKIPKSSWNIIFKPTPFLYEIGHNRLKGARSQGFTSLYFSTSNPPLLDSQPWEEISISDTDSEEKLVSPSSPPSEDSFIPSSSPSNDY